MRMRIVAATTLTAVLTLAGAGTALADDGPGDTAAAVASSSPGLLSGNAIPVLVHVPVNLCGTTVDVVGLLNPAAGNSCTNG
ncbi:chaplin [Streptomyces sp. NPDC051597]|uniref:chaplin n=1 Tax=Streptomyces sp. NPDC051597 TaxID=3155049 RepID=UPI0034453E3C